MSFIEIYQKDFKYKHNLSFTVNTSMDSKQTNDEKSKTNKNKKVCFNGVEIIEVESYKAYNQLTGLQLESTEKNMSDCKVCNCVTF